MTQVEIAAGVRIGASAFNTCTGLTHVEIPESVEIGGLAFRGCTGLTVVEIHEGVQIGDGAFAGCTGLTAVKIAEGVEIGNRAFTFCAGLRELVMHEGVTVDRMAFEWCDSLKFIIAPEGLPRDVFPEEATIVTHSAINNFVSAQRGLQGIEQMHDKMNIYRLCHSSDDVTQAAFNALSHLPVSTMLNVIQAYFTKPRNYEQSKQLLAWTMGAKFVDAYGDMEVSKMLGRARGGSDRNPSTVQAFLSVKEWQKVHRLSNFKSVFSKLHHHAGSQGHGA